MATLDSYTAASNADSSYNDTTKAQGVNAVIQTTYTKATVTSIKFDLKRTNTPTGTFVAKIYTATASDGTGVPNTQVGGNSGTVTIDAISTGSFTSTEFTWSSNYPTLDTGVAYCVYLDPAGSTVNGSNYISLGCENTAVDAGKLIYYAAGWATYGGYSIPFYVYGNELTTTTSTSTSISTTSTSTSISTSTTSTSLSTSTTSTSTSISTSTTSSSTSLTTSSTSSSTSISTSTTTIFYHPTLKKVSNDIPQINVSYI